MNREERWLLPEGVEELLPAAARTIENLRRRLLDLYSSWGYELVFPPLIEYLESLLNGTGRDLERETFKITDQLSGRLLGVRADITPQVARMDAHSLRRQGPSRLCYCSTALRTRAGSPGGTRIPYQIGVELFGHQGEASDLEVIALMLETLSVTDGVGGVVLDLGHVGIYRALVASAGLDEADEVALSDIFCRKASAELDAFLQARDLDAKVADAFRALARLAGGAEVLNQARKTIGTVHPDLPAILDRLTMLADHVRRAYPDVEVFFDLGELRGYHYHTGCIFAAYVRGQSEPLAKGGRYDHIGEVFGRARPATGFSVDLKMLAAQVQQAPAPVGILVDGSMEDDSLRTRVAELRAQGERVVMALPGIDNDPGELGCNRRLVRSGQGWHIESL